MARVTVEDCLDQEENRFALVVLAANRTRQLMKGATPLVKLQSYVTGCYGSLTSFNLLFAEEEDQFKGSGGE